jgi:hypothetical protein
MNSLIRDEIICKKLLTTSIDALSVDVSSLIVDNLIAANITTNTFESNSETIGNISTDDLTVNTSITVANTFQTDQFTIDTLTVPQLVCVSATTDTVNAESTLGTDIITTDGVSDELNASGTISSEQFVATAASEIENNLTVRAGEGTGGDFYISPSEGVFRGICFFKDVDVGIGSPSANISMNMRSAGTVPFLNAYNKFLGAIDSGSDFGGTPAVLSLSTPTTNVRTMRFQQDGNLAIYSDNVKIWQNGSMISDARVKENLQPIETAMEKILQIDGVLFDYTLNTEEKSCGVILEQVEKIVPECVVDNLVHLEKLVPLLIEGLRELRDRNDYISKHIN